MANTGTSSTLEKGEQQVSIFPKQILSSIYGNETLYNIIQPGIENGGVIVSTDSINLIFTIPEGTTFFFQRQETDPLNPDKNVNFIGKVSLTLPAEYRILKTTFSSSYGSLTANEPLYLIGDWEYNATNPDIRFVDFRLDKNLLSFTGNNNVVLLAKILNARAAIASVDFTKLHVSYELQQNRGTLNKLYGTDNSFMIEFESDGGGVKVQAGNAFTGNSFISYTSASSVMTPPLGLATYLSNENTGSIINIIGSEASYYQVDFLRVRYSEDSPHVMGYAWESFLVPATTLFDTVPTKQQIITFLAAQKQFKIVGNAHTLLVSIRKRVELNTSTITKNIWPETCIIFNESALDQNINSTIHNRFKLPVYSASDLV